MWGQKKMSPREIDQHVFEQTEMKSKLKTEKTLARNSREKSWSSDDIYLYLLSTMNDFYKLR